MAQPVGIAQELATSATELDEDATMTRRTPNVSDNRPNTKPVITAPMPWPVISQPTARLPPPSLDHRRDQPDERED